MKPRAALAQSCRATLRTHRDSRSGESGVTARWLAPQDRRPSCKDEPRARRPPRRALAVQRWPFEPCKGRLGPWPGDRRRGTDGAGALIQHRLFQAGAARRPPPWNRRRWRCEGLTFAQFVLH